MKRVILGALVLALSCVGLAAPAVADTGSGTISGINGVLYNDCRPHPYGYAVSVPADAGYWDLRVSLRGPDGHETATDFVALPDSSGTSTFSSYLCPPGDLYGTYTIRATLEWGPEEQTVDQSTQLADAHFTMRKPFTRTSLTVSTSRPAYRQLVTYRIGVRDERPTGYVATSFAWVVLQKRVEGHWVRIKGTRTLTHSNGYVRLRLRYLHHHKRMRVRAVAQEAPRFSRSVSPSVRLW